MAAYISWKVVTGFHLGPFMIRPHGVLIAVGFLAGALLMRRSTRRARIRDEQLWRVLQWGLVGGLIGMRAAWDLGHLDEMRSPVDLIAVWNGGMSLLGGLIGAVVLGGIAARRAGLPLLPMLDMAAPGLALGIAIGRFSDLIIGDHLGKPTTLPWGFRYVGGMHPLQGVPEIGTVVHPVALYDMVLTTALLLVLLRFARRPRAVGSAIALFTLWYATSRVLTDFLRTDPRRLLGLTGSQLTSIVLIAVVLTALVLRHRARLTYGIHTNPTGSPSRRPTLLPGHEGRRREMTVKKLFPILLVVVGLGFIGGGVYTAVRGLDAKQEVRAQLLAQDITTPEDASIPNARVDDAATADSMAKIIAVHAEEATGGETYAEMGRFLTPDGGETSDEALALKDDAGNPVANPLRNVAFQASALQTSLHTSHMAFNVADLVIGLGVFIAVVGLAIGGIGLALGALVNPRLARRLGVEPVIAAA